ncbi:DUF2934 domain-containing protein [Mesorhizobium sp.]|uniref:DUF2934 domain-containing protein n=1 Tax=Mesorhizobium sp. TaxID=1871066 RepID=UPI000FE80919|nr:MAG: DUF2934 domain-containing protein [Mesorhizobium sp.]
MSDDKHERIRRRAYEIWEREGQTHGLHERHWTQATFEIEIIQTPRSALERQVHGVSLGLLNRQAFRYGRP